MPAKRSLASGGKKWTSVMLPNDSVLAIARFVERHPELGYRSPPDFIMAALRAFPDFKAAAGESLDPAAHRDEQL